MVDPQKNLFTAEPTTEELIFYLRCMQNRTPFFDEMFPQFDRDHNESMANLEYHILGKIISKLQNSE